MVNPAVDVVEGDEDDGGGGGERERLEEERVVVHVDEVVVEDFGLVAAAGDCRGEREREPDQRKSGEGAVARLAGRPGEREVRDEQERAEPGEQELGNEEREVGLHR